MPPPNTQPLKPASATNKEANQYIPSFISKKPFYIGEDGNNDYLEHQRLQKAQSDQSVWYQRGKKLGPAATKYRKGACENCGAMTHKTKECISRPRAKGAKWTGKDIQADENIQEVDLGWYAKRDRWNGYDTKEYRNVIQEYEQGEEIQRKALADGEKGEDGEDDGDGTKYAEESDMGRQQTTSTRQLRIREDTAKYLLNLDLDSAKYDPKRRYLVDSGATIDKAAALVAEEGFMRASGDAGECLKAEKYAWESQEKTGNTAQHLQANPTSGEFHRRKEREEAENKRTAHQKMLLEKYGSSKSSLAESLRNTAVTESEEYVEYDETGAIKGAPRAIAKSTYAEDVFINNHTSVWGSWWANFKWGHACCHSTTKNSYCTGEAGKAASEEAERLRTGEVFVDDEKKEDMTKEIEWRREKEEFRAKDAAAMPPPVAKKRTMEEMHGGVSEEDMDEYRKKRTAANDPMAKLLGKDELI